MIEPKLTVRVLVEGAPGAGIATVMGELAQQVFATMSRSSQRLDNQRKLSLVVFDSGHHGGLPIRVEVISLGEHVGAAHSIGRRQVDAVMLVIEPTTEGAAAAQRRRSEIDTDLGPLADERRACVTLVAHQQDRPDALNPRQILTLMGQPDSTPIAPTSRETGGMQFAVAMTLREVLTGLPSRDRLGVARRAPSAAEALFAEFTPMRRTAPPAPATLPPPPPIVVLVGGSFPPPPPPVRRSGLAAPAGSPTNVEPQSDDRPKQSGTGGGGEGPARWPLPDVTSYVAMHSAIVVGSTNWPLPELGSLVSWLHAPVLVIDSPAWPVPDLASFVSAPWPLVADGPLAWPLPDVTSFVALRSPLDIEWVSPMPTPTPAPLVTAPTPKSLVRDAAQRGRFHRIRQLIQRGVQGWWNGIDSIRRRTSRPSPSGR